MKIAVCVHRSIWLTVYENQAIFIFQSPGMLQHMGHTLNSYRKISEHMRKGCLQTCNRDLEEASGKNTLLAISADEYFSTFTKETICMKWQSCW